MTLIACPGVVVNIELEDIMSDPHASSYILTFLVWAECCISVAFANLDPESAWSLHCHCNQEQEEG